MSQYRKGANFERKVKKLLEAKGMFVVRSAGSKGPCDLVAFQKVFEVDSGHGITIRPTSPWLIQVKATEGARTYPGKLETLASHYGAVPVLARMRFGEINFIDLRLWKEISA